MLESDLYWEKLVRFLWVFGKGMLEETLGAGLHGEGLWWRSSSYGIACSKAHRRAPQERMNPVALSMTCKRDMVYDTSFDLGP